MLSQGKSRLLIALGFAIFGIGVRAFTLIEIPWIVLSSVSKEQRIARVRHRVRSLCSFYVWTLRILRLIDVQPFGFERLDSVRGALLIANHPTLLDAIFILARAPHVCCIAKPSLKWLISYRILIWAADYILADKTHHLIPLCIGSIKAGSNLLIFPEGTRSTEGRLGAFYPGAAAICLRGGSPVYPLRIRTDGPLLQKNRPWFDQPSRLTRVFIHADEDVAAALREGLSGTEREIRGEMSERMHDYFQSRLQA